MHACDYLYVLAKHVVWQVRKPGAWFLKIDPVRITGMRVYVYVCVCLCVCVCVHARGY